MWCEHVPLCFHRKLVDLPVHSPESNGKGPQKAPSPPPKSLSHEKHTTVIVSCMPGKPTRPLHSPLLCPLSILAARPKCPCSHPPCVVCQGVRLGAPWDPPSLTHTQETGARILTSVCFLPFHQENQGVLVALGRTG